MPDFEQQYHALQIVRFVVEFESISRIKMAFLV